MENLFAVSYAANKKEIADEGFVRLPRKKPHEAA